MEIVEELKKIIDKRKKHNLYDDLGISLIEEKEIELLCVNLEETCKCLDTLSPEYYFWVTETFEDISEHFKSKELIECMKRNAKRTGVDCEDDIEFAIQALNYKS